MKRKTLTGVDNWLNSRGGREIEDVKEDRKGYYVLMWNGKEHQYDRHYLPVFYQTNGLLKYALKKSDNINS